MNPPETLRRQNTPFLILLSLMIVGIGVWVALATPALHHPATLALYGALLIIHTLLHWLALGNDLTPRWVLPYLFVQGALAFVIAWLGNQIELILCLYLPLIGEAAGVQRQRRRAALALVWFVLLSGANFVLIYSRDDLYKWLFTILPLSVLVTLYVILFIRQAEARTRAQRLAAEMEEANRQLSDYAARIEDLTLAAERQRMARELHDTLAQGLAGLILQLEAADSHLQNDHPQRAQTIIQQAMARARGTLAESRRVIDELRSGQAAQDDFAAAVAAEAAHFRATSGAACQVQLDLPVPLPPALAEHSLRILREGLTNAARHARCQSAAVRLYLAGEQLHIEIEDDGQGFVPSQASGGGHYGLLGMSERARLAGGSLDIHSQPGGGASLLVTLPLPPKEDSHEPSHPHSDRR